MSGLTSISPLFIVASLKTSISFYIDKLGFKLAFSGPEEDPFFAMVSRDKISIMLKEITPEVGPMPNHTRHEWAHWDAYVYVPDPDVLFKEFQSREVQFHQPLEVNGDNLLGFEIKDADGYVLYFGRPNN